MGLLYSKEEPPVQHNMPDRPESIISSKHQARQSSIRVKSKQPMPEPSELERRFTKVLVRSSNIFVYFFANKSNMFYSNSLQTSK